MDPVTVGVLIAGAGVAATALGSVGTAAATAYDVHKDRRQKRKDKKNKPSETNSTTSSPESTAATLTPHPQQGVSYKPDGTPVYGAYNPGQWQAQGGQTFITQTVTYGPPVPQGGYGMPPMAYQQQPVGYFVPQSGYPQQPIGHAMPAQGMPQGYPYPGYYGAQPMIAAQPQIPGQQAPLALTYSVSPSKLEVAELDLKKGRFLPL